MDLLQQADQAFKVWLAGQKKPYAKGYVYSQKVGFNETATQMANSMHQQLPRLQKSTLTSLKVCFRKSNP